MIDAVIATVGQTEKRKKIVEKMTADAIQNVFLMNLDFSGHAARVQERRIKYAVLKSLQSELNNLTV
jgi:hypothetical protein